MWMKKKLLPTDRKHEKFQPTEKIGLKEMKRIKLSSSKKVIENGRKNNKTENS